MSVPKTYPGVMLSSTFTDLQEHRAKAMKALEGAEFKPVAMEYSGARSAKDVIETSLKMVADASAYILIIGHKYGQTPKCPDRNPKNLSITELEFDEAIRLNRPILLFIMADDHKVVRADVETNDSKRRKLKAFCEKSKTFTKGGKVNRVYETYNSLEDFETRITTAAAWLREDLHRPPITPRTQPVRATRRHSVAEALTLPATRLFGRDDEAKMLLDAVASCAPGVDPDSKIDFVVLHAFGGAGKTALMRQLFDRLKPDFKPFEAVIGWSAYSQGVHDNANTDAKAFIDQALTVLGYEGTALTSERDGGEKLAHLIHQTSTLLLLDGIEPLQHSPLINEGFLKDPGLAALIKTLATLGHPGLVIITSRQPLPELKNTTKVIDWPLDRLSSEAGADLLKSLGCHGPDKALKSAVNDVLGHALSLILLGTYITEVKGGDITKRDHLKLSKIIDTGDEVDEADPTARYARRSAAILRAYIALFAAEAARDATTGTIERTLLNLTGLFDRPAEGEAVRLLLGGDAIPGLTDGLHALPLSERQDLIKKALRRLRKLGLLTGENPHDSDALDAHPIIRDHFAKAFKAETPEAFRAAHQRLYRHYAAAAPDLPDDLIAMQPLFHAIGHACKSGFEKEALDDIYLRRIRRNDAYINRQLGAYAANLSVLAHFFDRCWDTPLTTFAAADRAWLLGQAGFGLRALNRLSEAESAMPAALAMYTSDGNWINVAINAGNLSELKLVLGEVPGAIATGRTSVEWADRSADSFQKFSKRTTLGDALAQSGDLKAALDLFVEAEHLQAEDEPNTPRLYSVQGYQYCDLLLDLGRASEVSDRAAYGLAMATRNQWLLAIGLDTLSSARAEAAQALSPEDNQTALATFNDAVSALLRADSSDHIPRGYLALAAHLRRLGRFSDATRDLNKVYDLSSRSGMRLFLTDYHLESARLALAQINNAPPEATTPLDPPPPPARTDALNDAEHNLLAIADEHTQKAAQLIRETGYHRRDRERDDLNARIAVLRALK